MISIIVPVYKVEPYLEKCIKSIISQSFQDWELILVDDGSPDRCGEICDRFAELDPRICVIHQSNTGLSAARNAGMKVIRGDYVTFVDSDDFIDKDHLKSLYSSLRSTDSDISIAGYQNVNEEGLPLPAEGPQVPTAVVTGREACIRLMSKNETIMVTAWGKLYSKKLFPLIHYPERKLNEDEYITYQLLYESNSISFTGKNTYNYLKRSNSITAKFSQRHLEVVDAFESAVSYFSVKGDDEMIAIAQKQFLRVTRVLYLKSEGLPEKERLLLLRKWKKMYHECFSDIAKNSSLTERTTNWLFYSFPVQYSRLYKFKTFLCTM